LGREGSHGRKKSENPQKEKKGLLLTTGARKSKGNQRRERVMENWDDF